MLVKKIIFPATQSLLPIILITGDMMPKNEFTPLLGNGNKRKTREVLNNLTEDNTQIIETLSTDQKKAVLQRAISEENIVATEVLLDAGASYYILAEEADIFFSDKAIISSANAIYKKVKNGKLEIISAVCPYLAKHDLEILETLAEANGHTRMSALFSAQIELLESQKPRSRCMIM